MNGGNMSSAAFDELSPQEKAAVSCEWHLERGWDQIKQAGRCARGESPFQIAPAGVDDAIRTILLGSHVGSYPNRTPSEH